MDKKERLITMMRLLKDDDEEADDHHPRCKRTTDQLELHKLADLSLAA